MNELVMVFDPASRVAYPWNQALVESAEPTTGPCFLDSIDQRVMPVSGDLDTGISQVDGAGETQLTCVLRTSKG